MSITGYGPVDGMVRVTSTNGNGVNLRIPRGNVINSLKLSRATGNKWVEIAAPFLIRENHYKLEFNVCVTPFREHLPVILDASKISLLFMKKLMRYEDEDGDIVEGNEELCHAWNAQEYGEKSLQIDNNELTGTLFFNIKGFGTKKNKSFLYLGLTIYHFNLQYLIYDIGVFTNASIQLKGNRPAAGKNILRGAFWWSEQIFADTKEVLPPKKRETIDYGDAEEVKEEDTKKRLKSIIEVTQESLQAMKVLAESHEPLHEEALTGLVTRHFTSILPLFEDQKSIIPREYVFIDLPKAPPLPDFLE